jgi:hypothetical protein
MIVIALCAALVALGAVLVVRDGAGPPGPIGAPVRYGVVVLGASLGAGLLAAGAGGRIAMRVLAVTSPETVAGVPTEANAIIGEITLGGTIGFVAFAGPAAGLLTAGLYALLLPVLPRGRAGGMILGAVLLVVAGSRLDPLRAENFDFALIGPDWLAVALFGALALFQGLLTVALAGRLARGAPVVRVAPRLVIAGRVGAVAVVLAALPGFAGAVADILTAA